MSEMLESSSHPEQQGAEEAPNQETVVPSPIVAQTEDDAPGNLLPFPVVGIGASAGGLEALIDLFSNLPADTGMAFVIVVHLAPDQKSHLVEILGRQTSMEVSEIESDTRPRPNHVYVLPPNAFVSLSHATFQLHSRPESHRAPMALDHFFRSLGADQKNRAVGVVLSGSDSDGALGLKAIKGEGGIAIVQHPDTARFPGMPRSSIAADHVDLIVPPAEIAAELARLADRFRQPLLRPLEDGKPVKEEESHLTRILNLMRSVSGVDFRLYKPSTIRRRIARRMMLKFIDGLPEYVKFLQSHPEELRQLHEEALINVTQFFRDPDVFQALKGEILPYIVKQRSENQQVRFWVAGCSTGEEVYSMAMCLLEYVSDHRHEPPIQIFGTDASDASIQKARLGMYPESIVADVSPERLRRFFTRIDKGYQISKRVRELCIFARQNLCHDPPFSKLDFIGCRNVLIYFGPALQRQLIATFSYALRPNGYLLLGTSEAIGEFTDLFTPVDRKHKFYAKTASAPVLLDLPQRIITPHAAVTSIRSEPTSYPPANYPDGWTDVELQRAVDRLVLARYGPPGLVINDKLEILQSRGQMGPYLEMAQGAVTFQLLRMIRESIAAEVRTAVQKAISEDAPVQVDDLILRQGTEIQRLGVEVLPVPSIPARSRCFLILFTPKQDEFPSHTGAELADVPNGEVSAKHKLLIAHLQQDLTSTKLYLQSLIEERDIKNQELTSANEEIQSSNEELQSTNEELETMKEELQSSNEELQTVNDELYQRNVSLTQTTNDLTNLFTSVNIPVLMLNSELQIRQFTPPTQRLFNVRPVDVGRPIGDFRLNLSVENLQLILQDVLETLGTRELEVQDHEGRWHLLRIRPYRTTDNKIEGVVLALVDVDQLRRNQQELKQARDFAQTITQCVDIPIVVLSTELKIRAANVAFRSLAGLSLEDLEGRSFPDFIEATWNMESIRHLLQTLRQQGPGERAFEADNEIVAPEDRAFHIKGRLVKSEDEHLILLTLQDVTTQKQAERLMAGEREQLEGRVRSTVQALGRTQEELRALSGSLFTAQDEERRRVARELHDDISQKLAVLGMDLERLKMSLPDDSEARNLADSLYSRAGSLSEDVRQISHGLHPSMLDDLGLPYALKALGEEFSEREKSVVTFHRSNVPDRVPPKISATLYRITQEALRNVEKHAGKTHIKITLEGNTEGIRLEIADFGEGFNLDEAHHGLGLVSMSERARLVSGKFSVQSALGKGTVVTIEVPMSSLAAIA